jgi:hypothetical protein
MQMIKHYRNFNTNTKPCWSLLQDFFFSFFLFFLVTSKYNFINEKERRGILTLQRNAQQSTKSQKRISTETT